jgi:hypothetical protein
MDEVFGNENFVVNKLKSIPKQYYIVAGGLVFILALYLAYKAGKNSKGKLSKKKTILPENKEKEAESIEKERENFAGYDEVEPYNENDVYLSYINNEMTALKGAEILNISLKTFYKRAKKFKDARSNQVDE